LNDFILVPVRDTEKDPSMSFVSQSLIPRQSRGLDKP